MPDKPVRVLHVLGGLDRGGAETWAVQLLEHLDAQRIRTDFLIHRQGGVYENRVRACGAEVFFCGLPNQPFRYTASLSALLQMNRYQVVHSHLQVFSGLVLRVAHGAGVPGRVAHARNSNDGQSAALHRQAYRALMRHWIRRYATHLLAVSTEAAEGAFWKGVTLNDRCRLITGIDFSPFQIEVDRKQVRSELEISDSALVVGHVGSFRRQKNHEFIVAIARELLLLHADAVFVLIGDGALRPNIEGAVRDLGLEQAFRFLGERNDIPRLFQAMDAFLFPSLYEGLPRVLMEAQAAGLPCVVSSTITPEAAAWSGNVSFTPLETGALNWAQMLIDAAQGSRAAQHNGIAAIRHFEARGLSITANAMELTELYEGIASIGAGSAR